MRNPPAGPRHRRNVRREPRKPRKSRSGNPSKPYLVPPCSRRFLRDLAELRMGVRMGGEFEAAPILGRPQPGLPEVAHLRGREWARRAGHGCRSRPLRSTPRRNPGDFARLRMREPMPVVAVSRQPALLK